MAPFLFGGLVALIATGFVGIFVPFNSTVDLAYASGGCLIFSGYVIYDTFLINKKLSPDEYILGAISLYLDFLNLCECHSIRDKYRCSNGSFPVLSILRVLNNLNDR